MAVSTAPGVSPVLSWENNAPAMKGGRKKGKPLFALAVAVMVLLCAAGIWRMAHSSDAGQFVQVLSASRDIPAGVKVGFASVRYMPIPKKFVTRDMVTSLNYSTGRVTRTFIPTGEPIRAAMLFTEEGGLSRNITNDERAITLDFSPDAMVDHAIYPDDRVDVLVVSTKSGKKFTKTVCQAARVLISTPKEAMMARHMSNQNAQSITLAVSPDQSEKLSEAVDVGKLRLVLRSRLSRAVNDLAGSDPDDLLPPAGLRAADPSAVTIPKSTAVSMPLPPPMTPNSFVPAPPAALAPAAASGPLQWMVEVIMGDHKDTYGVPRK